MFLVTRRPLSRCLAVTLLLGIPMSGCDDRSGAGGERAAARVDHPAQDALAMVKESLAAGTPRAAVTTCVVATELMTSLDARRASHRALAAEVERACEHDVPLAILQGEVEKGEAAREANPDQTFLSACWEATTLVELGTLERLGSVARGRELLARLDAACARRR